MRFFSSVARLKVASRPGFFLFTSLMVVGLIAGCQAPQPGLGNRLMAHAALINSSGLTFATEIPQINVRVSVPLGWDLMDSDSCPLYVHRQWRSPNHSTGVGVAYIHLPLPMSAKALVWLAKTQYSKINAKQHRTDGRMLGEWTDSLGREWFEGENEKYHVKGYVVTNGFDAWAVYSGYRLKSPPNKADISLAYRGMDSIVPLPLEKQTPANTGLAALAASGSVK